MTALERLVARAAARGADAVERCDLCAEPVPDDHGGGHAHVLDERGTGLLCACRACALLFERDAAGRDAEGRGHFRLVPGRRLRLPDLPVDDLGVPVGLAFFVRHEDGEVTAHYPSPGGATRCDVDAAAWKTVAERCEPLRTMVPDVEALLVHTGRSAPGEAAAGGVADQRWIVPIDECYRLVAAVRLSWKGLSGGKDVWPEIERFFVELGARAGNARPRRE
ncbi:hypothetical protein BJF79_18085 [Actinomadura sp. CNU-125]|uniref:DUF5947 family protein n=1 Tax=Actinomadura sp. CNU-125 TaxID=1904961 RepID=UPI0009591644|nr:DUF5947 family protein [Actinomadura sp. CNU-125]OLT17017.1 hypothetical protein BJF79_18085 [Actinomadura sp. CNU-125]